MIEIEIDVKVGDALSEEADVLVLKYAQALYGVDAIVVNTLRAAGQRVRLPQPNSVSLEGSTSAIGSSRIFLVGVPPLTEFGYREIREFARTALVTLSEEAPQIRHALFTIHGPGYGLDEVEAFESELAGLVDAIRESKYPKALRKITIIERIADRAERLAKILDSLFPERKIKPTGSDRSVSARAEERLRSVGYASDSKPHVFVAMPFKDEMDDTYHYGIQRAVNAAGLLCERIDVSTFTGDVIERVRLRIRSAKFVIADLTDANPNVYLEIGYAWGVGVPTVLVVKNPDHLKFDVRGQRCLVYTKIQDLEEKLTGELQNLLVSPDQTVSKK